MRKYLAPLLVILMVAALGIYLIAPKGVQDTGSRRAAMLVIGNHANGSHTSPDNEFIRSICEPINENGGFLGVVLAEGNPSLIGKPTFIPTPANSTDGALKSRLDDPDGSFAAIHAISNTIPTTDEVDYLEAIAGAAASLKSEDASSCDDKTIYLIGSSGLSTKGEYLNFAEGIIEVSYEGLVARMIDSDALPDLTGLKIVWSDFGATSYPQPAIPAKYIKQMKELWSLVIYGAGATSVEFIDTAFQSVASDVETYPYVTPVPFIDASNPHITDHLYFNENILGFKPESCEYREGADGTGGNEVAERVLAPLADNLIATNCVVVICGTAYNDGSGDEVALSYARAEKVCDALISMGVAPNQVIAVGAGNLGVNVRIGSKTVDFFHADNPEASRAIHVISTEGGLADDVLARFGNT